jgi:hypothetical protein
MTRRPRHFHLVAAIAFLTATPVFANIGGGYFMPHLTFMEETQTPTRAAHADLPSCLDSPKTAETCRAAAAQALIPAPKKDK